MIFTPRGPYKTRLEMRARRYRFLNHISKRCPISMRHFDNNLRRFHQNWGIIPLPV